MPLSTSKDSGVTCVIHPTGLQVLARRKEEDLKVEEDVLEEGSDFPGNNSGATFADSRM